MLWRAAGLSAAFAPITGLLFVVEESIIISLVVWVTALTASLVANAVSLRIFGQVPVLAMTEKLPVFPLKDYWILIVLGIFLGVLGYGYEWVVLRIGKAYQGLGKIFHLPSHFHGLLAVLFIIPIGLYFPHLLGGGNELILALNGLHPA
ncbi:MAG: chloride channel protein [Streptococcus salivarius]